MRAGDEKQVYLKLYNTEHREKQKVIGDDVLRIYTCGPTVYDYAHIGNFRTYIFEDLMRKTLKLFGFKVRQVMNITDVDDKTIRGAIAAGLSLSDYTQTYIDAFFEDLTALGIERAEVYPYATDHILEMIQMIEQLLSEGVAYVGEDQSVYFNIRAFPSYGRLSHLCLDELKENASNCNSSDEYDKDSASDFVLWKGYDEERDGPIYWDSPFGKGRPGWHIECSAMAIKHLGETIDIHAGGVDNIFPHHENEIAQSEACTQKCFAKHWIHSEHLLVDGRKMSKSSGNFYTLRDLLQKGYDGRIVRYALLQTHYRVQLNFTLEGLDGARSAIRRLDDLVIRLQAVQGEGGDLAYREKLAMASENFKGALADDLNISEALAALFILVRELNVLLDSQMIGERGAREILEELQAFDTILGVMKFDHTGDHIPEEIREAFRARQAAREAKDYELADHYRNLIDSKGYLIEDSPQGSQIKKK